MKRSTALAATVLVSFCLGVQVGDAQTLPQMEARTLSDKTVSLPEAVRGRVSVFVVGFTRASRTPASAWGRRVAQECTKSACEFYQVAVLQDVPRLIRGMVVSGIRRGVPASQHDRFLLLYDKQDAWKQVVDYSDRDAGYIVVFDRNGSVAWRTHRPADDEGVAELRRRIAAMK